MNKEFIPYDEALELKKLRFDEPCLGLFHSDKSFYPTQCKSHEQYHGQVCSAPLYQQAFRWFRKNYSLFPYVEIFSDDKFDYTIVSKIFSKEEDYLDGRFDTYEEAELTCLRRLIELVKNNE
jgi:hypothetical protein